ncbi:hypothetical protein [Kribbella sp. CA-247076]|uniref:hypothetical protein n=1 Tax=Kribbella sp. CA-247076 TaxID=3239941 RepID=UPI003D91AED9
MSAGSGPIDFGGTGHINMFPAETDEVMSRLSVAGKPIADAWAKAKPALDADEQVVGTGLDDLSAGFRRRYNTMRPPLERTASEAGANFHAMGANGHKIVKQYVDLDQQQAERLRRLQ